MSFTRRHLPIQLANGMHEAAWGHHCYNQVMSITPHHLPARPANRKHETARGHHRHEQVMSTPPPRHTSSATELKGARRTNSQDNPSTAAQVLA